MKKINTHTKKATGNPLQTKWHILIYLREGFNRKQLEDKLERNRVTILGHLRDFKEKGLVKQGTVFNYYLTPKGQDITHEEFNKLFYGGLCRSPVEVEVDKRRRFHNLFFTSYIKRRPEMLPSINPKLLSKNNSYFVLNLKNGNVRIHTKRAVLQVDDFTAMSAYEGALETQQRLRELVKELESAGYELDRVFSCSGYHIADMWHPLALHFKSIGKRILVDDRLEIDFSHGVPEMEAINKNTAPEDMHKWELLGKAILGAKESNLKNFALLLRNLEV